MDHENLSCRISEYMAYLQNEERSENTITKYVRDLRAFFAFIGGSAVDKTAVLAWNEKLSKGYAATSVNSMLAAVNGFFDWLDLPQLKVKPVENPAGDFCTARKGTDAAGIRPPCESGTRTAQ